MIDTLDTVNIGGRSLLSNALAQNDVDMANHRLLNLDTSNLPPIGIPPTFVSPAHQWIRSWDAVSQTWAASQPNFTDIAGLLTIDQQNQIVAVGLVRSGTWMATPLAPDRVPTLDLIRLPGANVNLNSKRITHLANPIDAGDAVNLGFMDFMLQGLNPMEAVRVASPGSGRPWPGPVDLGTIDGIDINDGDRVLLFHVGTGHEYWEGIWIAHDGPWDLAPDTLGPNGLNRAYCTVLEGTFNAGKSFVQVASLPNIPPIPGDLPNWILFSSGAAGTNLIPGAGLSVSGNTWNVGGTAGRIAINPDSVDIDPGYVGQHSITTLGTIIDGTWNGDVVDGAHGGTGALNLGKTILLQGSFTTVDSTDDLSTAIKNLRFSLVNHTALTLPVAGTLATLAQPETFSSKRITRRISRIASNPNPSINTDVTDVFVITALTDNIVSMSTNLTGTPTDRQQLEIWIRQLTGTSGPSLTIAWGSKYMASPDLPLPTLINANMFLFMTFVYIIETSKWVLTAKVDKIA